jgi:TonB family protein
MEKLLTFFQLNIYLLVFYAFYWLFLKKETFHQLNRIYLLGAMTMSILLPFINIDFFKDWAYTEQAHASIHQIMYEFQPLNIGNQEQMEESTDWLTILSFIYWTGVLISLILFLRNTYLSYRAYVSPEFQNKNAFSFFWKVEVDTSLPEAETIQHHEEIHTKQLHFLDLLVCEILCILFWFNPVVFYYRNTLKIIHEYIADAHASYILNTRADYAELLFKNQFKVQADFTFIQPFYNQSLLKQRISMLMKNPSARISMLKYAVAAPLFFLMIFTCSLTQAQKQIKQWIEIKVEDMNEKIVQQKNTKIDLPKVSLASEAFIEAYYPTINSSINNDTTKIEAEFPGGIRELYKYMGKNIRYPAVAQRSLIQGTVEVGFIINRLGEVREPEILKNIGGGCGEEALRLLQDMPNWTPAMLNNEPIESYIKLPVVFKLDAPPTLAETQNEKRVLNDMVVVAYKPTIPSNVRIRSNSNLDNVLIRINGIESSEEMMKNLKPEQIESLSVVKDRTTLEKYGEKAIRSIIDIKLKMDNSGSKTETTNENEIFTSAEKNPEFSNGGISGMYKYLSKNIKYPKEAKKARVSGRVYIKMVIEKDGSIGEVKVLQGIGFGCDEEAVRVIKSMPNWKPAYQNGNPVRIYYQMPVVFKL